MGNGTDDKLDIAVLYVEDEPATRDNTARILRREVRELYLAENGREGLELFLVHRPDIVITDISMPVMGGLELVEKIKAVDGKTPVIITTAYDETGFFQKSIELRVDRYILKPVDISHMQKTLGELSNTIHIERRLREQTLLLEQYKQVVDETNIVCKTDREGRITYLNEEFCKISGYTRKDLMGQPHEIILHPKMQESMLKELQQTILSKKIWTGILEHKTVTDSSYYADVTIFPMLDLEDNIIEFIYIGHDVTKLMEVTKLLKDLSITDSLTEIYNRMAFNDLLHRELGRAKRYKLELALIMFDIDHFKKVNDTYGHMTGDDVLREMVWIVKKTIRNVDIFARWGGEEFMIVTPETCPEGAEILAERLRIAVEEHCFPLVGQVTASFGVACFTSKDNPNSLIHRADKALYRAKETGRNRVEMG